MYNIIQKAKKIFDSKTIFTTNIVNYSRLKTENVVYSSSSYTYKKKVQNELRYIESFQQVVSTTILSTKSHRNYKKKTQ